jgi:hypothetical protein
MGGRKPINLKAGSVIRLPVFRDADAQRRCIVPVFVRQQEGRGVELVNGSDLERTHALQVTKTAAGSSSIRLG